MRQTVYISLAVCSLAFSACGNDIPSPQAEESHILSLDFQPEGLLAIQASGSSRAALQTENGEIEKIGVCITAENSHDPYHSGGASRYTFTTEGVGYTGTGTTTMSPLYLTNKNATIQAFHPSTETATEIGIGDYTIPVTIPSTQSFSTVNGSKLQCAITDYLYGSAQNTAGDVAPIKANNTNASPTIYMHHALAKVVFTLQCDENRTPNATYDCVKSITMAAQNGNPFLYGTSGTMQINNGTLAGLSATNKLTFKPADGAPLVAVGKSGSPSTVACGLAVPLSALPGEVTLTVTLGKNGDTTYDRTYTATNSAFNVQWQKGHCYTYNMVLGNKLTATQVTTSWVGTSSEDTPAVTPKEKGISNLNELAAFATAWNKNGLTKNADGTFDYSPYEPYGWYEKDDKGNRVFTIKITNSFVVLKDMNSTWVPIGNDSHPLTIPIDGQGWQITFDFSNGKQTVADSNIYAGIVGYTRSSISNVRILCSFNAGSGATADNNLLESGDATYTGILAGRSEGDITNCTVEMEGTTLLTKPSGSAVYMGGLVGHCSQNISNCAVYQTYSTSATIKTLPAATSTINMGALAGKVEGTVNNCYTYMGNLYKEEPTPTTSSTVNAGWLTGSGDNFIGCHYYAGTSTDCTPTDYSSVTGVQSMIDLTGLCTALNTDLATHPLWTRWTEKKDTNTGVTSVFLFDYRNKK